MSTSFKELLELYDQAAAKARPPTGWGLRIRVKIGDWEVETEQIPPPAARGTFTQAKAVKRKDLEEALSGYQGLLNIEETETELIIKPTQRLGNDWPPINVVINTLADSKRTWVSESDSMKSRWIVKKG